MRQRSKRYQNEAKKAVQTPLPIDEAVKKLKTFASTKFDQSVEIVMHLGINPSQPEQAVRGAVSLPHGIGKARRVIAFCEESEAEAAKAAGAIEAGADELIAKVMGGWTDFDVAIASPKVMGKVGKLGRILGPQGKMPSPKNGTVTADVVQAVREFAAGKVEFRNDAGGNVHAVVGKLSFDEVKLIENIEAFINHIKRLRPPTMKGTYIKNVYLSATMSPSIPLAVE
ncbi:MAG TPA: 50S ribosomal protein L1 [Anaerohalosphaeraceae bacterium]|jgi:large subunit ribosomal protein L1|nr:50S ribosomal protein L1 [Anaerohalosphaeraceae bacterium]HPB92018.1 50S ribosomal protein L1 [Anaerohalosphaeraceae bacterium]HRT22730.1 50S ribosomal protein L1 [Anaerohalosphaeraceae bacterium]HRU14232.1 50S ribosomal protein L1 [Anaerohalosphaeraceae bacterium]